MRYILVVEDDPLICDLFAAFLGDEGGYRVIFARNGTSALSALGDSEHLDMAIIDMLLPSSLGTEVAQTATDRNVPVLFMSGSYDQLECLSTFDLPHIAKPFSLTDLRAQLHKMFEQRERVVARVRVGLEALRKSDERPAE